MTDPTGIFRTFLVLRPRAGHLEEFAGVFVGSGVIEAAVPYGILRGELLDLPEREAFLVAAVWRSATDYAGWQAAPERAALLVGLQEVLDSEGVEGWTEWDPAAGPDVAREPLDVSSVVGEDTPHRRHVVVA